MKRVVLLGTICLGLIPSLRAQQLLPEAVRAFPASTTSLEYDALSKLRLLPTYRNLRKQYTGEGLQRAQKDLLSLGISEGQLNEVAMASGPNGFFGLVAGNFHLASVQREAAQQGTAQLAIEDGPVFCAKDGLCFLLPAQEDGRAFFGTMEQLRAVSDVRQGRAPSLETNTAFTYLESRMDQQAPVLGFAPGSEISDWIGSSIPQPIASRLDLTRLFSNIQTFSYAVKLDSKAHVSLNIICSSDQAGAVLRDTLSAASGLERAAAMAAGPSSLPFDNMTARSTGRYVAVNLDAPLP
jgi:hypothetical protein